MLNDLKELEKLFKICRKQGVLDLSFEGVTVKFGELPTKAGSQSEDLEEVPTEGLTPEQMMFYAVETVGQQ